MEYVNPVSISQMAQVPKDTSLPGTGYGLMQGFNEGEAMNRSKDFLNMAQASQAQDYVNNQFKMQTAWEDYPLAKMQKEANLAQTQSSTATNKFNLEKAHEHAKRERVMGQMSVIAGAREAIRNAKTPMERAALFDTIGKQLDRLGYPRDQDLMINPADENGWGQFSNYADLSHQIVAYDQETQKKLAELDPKLRSAEGIARDDLAGRRAMNREDNDTALRVAALRERASMAISGGAQALNNFKVDIAKQWREVLKKPPKTWTPDDVAINAVASRMLASQYTTADEITNNPVRQGQVAEQKAGSGIKGTMNMIDALSGGQSDAMGDPSIINRGVGSTQIEGETLPAKVIKYDNKGNRIQ